MNEVKDIRSPSSLTVYKQRFICSDMQAKSMSLFLFLRNSPTQARAALFVRFLAHTLWYTTVGRTPLDEWSARRREYLTAHNTHKRQTSMPPGWICFVLFVLLRSFVLSFYPLCTFIYPFVPCHLFPLQHTTQTSMTPADFCFVLSSLSWFPCFLPFVLTVQHTQHKHPCSRRDLNPQAQQTSGRRPPP